MEDKYIKALDLFTDKDDPREWINEPFTIEDLAIATTGHSLINMPKTLTFGIEELKGCEPNKIINVLPKQTNQNFIIKVADLKERLQNCPLVDELEDGEIEECDACYGSCEVDFEFSHNGKDYTCEAECPVCNGEGQIEAEPSIPTGRKIPKPDTYAQIKLAPFALNNIHKLIQVAEILEADDIELVYQISHDTASYFKVGEANVLIMPVHTGVALEFKIE